MAKNENEDLERPHPKNMLNDMGGDRFLYFTKSVLTTAYPAVYSHELRKQHGANKPPQLMAQLIEFFTKTGMSVLDPFAGVGGTLIGASIATPGPRKCVGIEISQITCWQSKALSPSMDRRFVLAGKQPALTLL